MKYVVVGFKVMEENSVYYNKTKDREKFFEQISKAIDKGAEFISVRIIRDEKDSSETNLDSWIDLKQHE